MAKNEELAPGRRRRPRRLSGQEIIDAIVVATEQILTEHGLDGFTTKRLAARAGVGIGSVYQYFQSKEGVVAELARRLERRAVELALGRLAKEPNAELQRIISIFVGVLLEGGMGDTRMRRALLLEVPRDWIEAQSREVDEVVLATIVGLIRGRSAEVRQENPEMMAFIAHHAVESVVEAVILRRPEWLGSPALQREIELLVERYLKRS